MAPPKRPWFRFYTEALTDPKLRRLTPQERWLWVAVLGAARQSHLPGFLMLTEREAMTIADLADLAGVSDRAAKQGVDKMARLGLIDRDENVGALFVTKWSERQYESDDTAKRTAKHRAKERSIAPEVAPPESESDPEPSSSSEERAEDDDFASQVWDRMTRGRLERMNGSVKNPRAWSKTVRAGLPAEYGDELARLRARYRDLTPSHAAAALEGDTHSLQYLTRAE